MKILHAQDIKSHFNIAILLNHGHDAVSHENFAKALIERLKELEFSEENITLVTMNSFLDYPFIASQLAETKEYSAILIGLCYPADEEQAYLQILTSCIKIGVKRHTPIIVEGFNQSLEATPDSLAPIARKLAERAYTVVSIAGQIS
jgi:hypothetical protein